MNQTAEAGSANCRESYKISRKSQFKEKNKRKREQTSKQICEKSYDYKGSYTVEAAILMWIVLSVMAALLIAAFYLHDRAVLQGITSEIASAGSNTVTEKELQKVTGGLKKTLTKNRLMGSRNVSGQVNTGKDQVSAICQGNYLVPGLVKNYFSNSSLKIQVSWKSKKIQPADTIRKIRGIRKLINGGRN